VAGSFYATSGIFFHDGACRDVWLDPDRTVIADPYLRGNGWQGQIATGTSGGRPVACSDNNNDQVRQSGGAAYYSSSITGGVTIRYGAAGWGQRLTQYVGAGVKSPFIVRLQDWGLTGPIEKAQQAGHRDASPFRAVHAHDAAVRQRLDESGVCRLRKFIERTAGRLR
jgi:hypothetical protein